MSKVRTWNKHNVDIAQTEIEYMMTDPDANRKLYGIIRALLWAVSYILSWIERQESKERSEHGHMRG